MSPKQKSFLRNPWSNHLPFQQPTLPPVTTKMSLRVSDQSPLGPQRFIAPLTPIIFQMPASKGCKGLRACPLRPALLNWAPARALCPEAP